ncbi:MAG: hypothetical protein ACSHYB_11135 [Roseibacillus sp.]
MLASCASNPNYSNNNSYGGGYPNSGGIDATKTAALVAAGIAGLSLYHYGKEKDKRKDAERAYANRHNERNWGYNNGYGYNRDQRGNTRRGGW